MMAEGREAQFAYIGRIERSKGIHILLDAWRWMGEKAPGLLICGTGTGYDDQRRYIGDERLSKVRMCGYVPNGEARAILAASSALILPTQWYEGFPMVIAEAYSVGTPVIGSDIGNVAGMIEDGVTGIKFRYDDHVSLAGAVRQIQEHPLDRGRIRRVYDTYLTEDRNYRTLMDIYDAASRTPG